MTRWLLTFDVPGLFPPGPNDRLHWATRAMQVKEWRTRVYAAAVEAGIPKLERARVAITFHTKRGRLMDQDNLGRAKPLYDGLVGCWIGRKNRRAFLPGILADDDAAHMERSEPIEIRDGTHRIDISIEAVAH